MVDGLLARAKEEGGRLRVGPRTPEGSTVLVDRTVGEATGVGHQVELNAGVIEGVDGEALFGGGNVEHHVAQGGVILDVVDAVHRGTPQKAR